MVEAASTKLDPSFSHLRKLRKELYHRKKVRFPQKVADIWTFTVADRQRGHGNEHRHGHAAKT
jgi:hypothetical protein